MFYEAFSFICKMSDDDVHHHLIFTDKIQPIALPSIAELLKTFVGYQAVVIVFGKWTVVYYNILLVLVTQ